MPYGKKGHMGGYSNKSGKMNEHLTTSPGTSGDGYPMASFKGAGGNVVGSKLKDRGMKKMKY